ncbi:MAG: hypothetical protein V1722_02755 [Candidatus Micrarchaeota archaeon]
MPLEWETHKIQTPEGEVGVTHWKKHNPRELLAALKTPEWVIFGTVPALTIHQFGRHQLAVRNCAVGGVSSDVNAYFPPTNIFNRLQTLAASQRALVEMPVAFIEQPDGRRLLVTLWKKDSRPLNSYLSDSTIPRRDRIRASFEFVRQLAKLHALGFVHTHPGTRNAVRNVNGSVQLIDPTLLRETHHMVTPERDLRIAIEAINSLLRVDEFPQREVRNFEKALREVYKHTLVHPDTIVRHVPKLTKWQRVKRLARKLKGAKCGA